MDDEQVVVLGEVVRGMLPLKYSAVAKPAPFEPTSTITVQPATNGPLSFYP
jgi:hypothetical protein